MRKIEGIIDGPLKITDDSRFSGIANGDISVAPNVSFKMSGILNGDLIVGENSQVTFDGMINGTLRNKGGTATVVGKVSAVDDPSGSTVVSPDLQSSE
ncbi:hypothetical protein ACSSV1_002898 [Labrenzia sp. MBR-25]